MEVILYGGLIRAIQALASATPTILIGLFIAAILRYYVGPEGTRRLFGGENAPVAAAKWFLVCCFRFARLESCQFSAK